MASVLTFSPRLKPAEQDWLFGDFRLSPSERRLYSSSGAVKLGSRAFDLLWLLVNRAAALVSKEEIFDQVWAGRIVSDAALTTVVRELRIALRDERGSPAFIESVYGKGYRFVAPVRREEHRPATPFGFRIEDSDAAPRPFSSWQRRWALVLTAVLILAGALLWQLQSSDAGEESPSLAVLPFRNLAADDPHFAEGVAEEVLNHIARQPGLQVTGRTSSWMFKNDAEDVRAIGKKLGVAYVLEGSVRRSSDEVLVNVALVRTADGRQLWSERYQRPLDDIFSIQHQIGQAVAASISQRLMRFEEPTGPLRTRGEVYAIYVTARALLRDREPAKSKAAVRLLERAVELDPNYAPAWALLGAAVQLSSSFNRVDSDPAANATALRYVRRALQLAPTLAQAHGSYAMVLGPETPEAFPHIRRAAELDPSDSNIQSWLAASYLARGEFERELEALERAAKLDPLFRSVAGRIVRAAPALGRNELAQRQIRRLEQAGSPNAAHIRGHHLEALGEISEALDQFELGRKVPQQTAGDRIDKHIGYWLLALGYPDEAQRVWQFDPGVWNLHNGRLPPVREIVERNRTAAKNADDAYYTLLATRLMVNEGRGAELASGFEPDDGLIHFAPAAPGEAPLPVLQRTPLAAMILRQAGRGSEADRLLDHADQLARATLARGRAPHWFLALAAQTWALQGRRELAIGALQQAIARGWIGSGYSLTDIDHDPAFHSLRGDTRFERLRQHLRQRYAREREETRRGYLARSRLT